MTMDIGVFVEVDGQVFFIRESGKFEPVDKTSGDKE